MKAIMKSRLMVIVRKAMNSIYKTMSETSKRRSNVVSHDRYSGHYYLIVS